MSSSSTVYLASSFVLFSSALLVRFMDFFLPGDSDWTAAGCCDWPDSHPHGNSSTSDKAVAINVRAPIPMSWTFTGVRP